MYFFFLNCIIYLFPIESNSQHLSSHITFSVFCNRAQNILLLLFIEKVAEKLVKTTPEHTYQRKKCHGWIDSTVEMSTSRNGGSCVASVTAHITL